MRCEKGEVRVQVWCSGGGCAVGAGGCRRSVGCPDGLALILPCPVLLPFFHPAGKYTLDYSGNPLKPRLGVEDAHSVHFGDMAPQDKLFVDCDAQGDVFFCPGSSVRGAVHSLSPPACLPVWQSQSAGVAAAGSANPRLPPAHLTLNVRAALPSLPSHCLTPYLFLPVSLISSFLPCRRTSRC
jgi:hypothetical protein